MAAKILRTMMPMKKIGRASVPSRNDRFLTILMYSFLATIHSLRIQRLRAALHHRDKDVVQRRLGDFKALDLETFARGQSPKDVLRVGAGGPRHVPIAVGVARFQHTGDLREIALP